MSVERESSPVTEIEESFQDRRYEGTISIDNCVMNRSMLQELFAQEMQESYGAVGWGSHQQPSRAERRKKASVKDDEELHDGYRRGLHKMMGRGKRWS
jgi:hypothetical protein